VENIESSGKVTPTLFVGLGGMGSKCLKSIWTKIVNDPKFDERLKGAVQALAIDTDAGQLLELESWSNGLIKTGLISGFDKQGYAEQLRGNGPYDQDEYFTQWCPYDYEFRGGGAAGAGQIRIESRLAVYHECENKAPTGLVATINNAVKAMYDVQRGFTNFDVRPQVHIFFSVAGGTGSGSHLMMAYLIRQAFETQLSGRVPFVTANIVLPQVFGMVAGENAPGIYANGYAALKEIEHHMKLASNSPLVPEKLEFHYNPGLKRSSTYVKTPPFDLCYLLGSPGGFRLGGKVGSVSTVAADACYLNLFSPISVTVDSDKDNYEQHWKALYPIELGKQYSQPGYTPLWATYGASVYLVPAKEIANYCAKKMASSAINRTLLMNDPDMVPAGPARDAFNDKPSPEKLKKMSEKDRKEALDKSFCDRLRAVADAERANEVEGSSPSPLRSAEESYASSIGEWDRQMEAWKAEMTKVAKDQGTLVGPKAEQLADSGIMGWLSGAGKSRKEKAAKFVQEKGDNIVSRLDRALADFFNDQDIETLGQRYFLLQLLEGREVDGYAGRWGKEQLVPGSEKVKAALTNNILGKGQQEKVKSMDASMTPEEGGWFGGDDEDSGAENAAAEAAKWVDEQVEAYRGSLADQQLYAIGHALAGIAESMLDNFRDLEERGASRGNEIIADCNAILRHGGEEANLFQNDVELLSDPNERRLWEWFFVDKCEMGDAKLADSKVQELISRAMTEPVEEPGGGRRPPESSEVIDKALELLEAAAYEQVKKYTVGSGTPGDRYEHGLTMEEAAILTQVYMNVEAAQGNLTMSDALRKFGKKMKADCEQDEGTRTALQGMIGSQIARVFNSAAVLEAFDDTAMTGQVKDLRICLLACHEDYLDGGILSDALASQMRGVSPLGGWHDRKKIIVYNAVIGAPVYCFPRAVELREAYNEIRDIGIKELHIDQNFRDLDDLDVNARLAKLREQDEYKEKPEFARDLAVFLTGVLSRQVRLDDTGLWEAVNEYTSHVPGSAGTFAFNRKLAPNRIGAVKAFTDLSNDPDATVRRAWYEPVRERFNAAFQQGGEGMETELGRNLKLIHQQWGDRILEMKMAHASTNVEAVAEADGRKGNVRDHVKSLGIHELHELEICYGALERFIQSPFATTDKKPSLPPGVTI